MHPKYGWADTDEYGRPASMVAPKYGGPASMVGADADPPTAHGRCWVTAEQLGMWPLDHGCCSFIPRRKIKTFFANAVELVG